MTFLMGTYLNPNNENFCDVVQSGRYVDKTMLIDVANRMLGDPFYKFICVCVSRPRRFGKSMAGDMLAAYYSRGADSKKLFSRLKIAGEESFEKHLNKYNVIKIDLNATFSEWGNISIKSDKAKCVMSYVTNLVCNDFTAEFPQIKFPTDQTVSGFIQQVYKETGEKFVCIIDEYDVLVREQVSKDDFNRYLDFLVSLFKNSELKPAIALAYITGILPVIKDKVQSKLNTFKEYTMLDADDFAEFTGFTTEEVRSLCKKYSCNFDECRSWYDGYKIGNYEIYNPEAVIQAVPKGKFKSYWSKSSSYEVISDKIKMNFSGTKDCVIKMLSGGKVDVDIQGYKNTLSDFANKNDVFTYLIHLGYLAYDEETGQCYIPNWEISGEWQRAIHDDASYEKTNEIIAQSKELLLQTLQCNQKAVEQALDESHVHVTSLRSYNKEDALQCAIYLAYIYALNEYIIVREMPAGNGIADIVYIPKKTGLPALIIELKRNGSAESAMNQIKEKKYFKCLDNWHGDILFVGTNYDEQTKKHECEIERFVKE